MEVGPVGIDVEVVPFGGGSEWLLALTSGQVDMAHGYFENAVRARSQGRDIILIDNILPTLKARLALCEEGLGLDDILQAAGAPCLPLGSFDDRRGDSFFAAVNACEPGSAFLRCAKPALTSMPPRRCWR